MSKIVFFSIPAYGHTNPTIEVVRALTQRGNTVRYYSFDMFRGKIEAAGAQFVSCDAYLPPIPKDFEYRTRYDFSSLISMITHTTVSMEVSVCTELKDFLPDCIVSDSICIWGKLFAKKMKIPMVCSTTTFAFNGDTAKMMKPGVRELFHTLTGIPKTNKNIRLLRQHGYHIKNMVQLIQNDKETDTIVYTSRAFQPLSETFGEKYTFIGPSIPNLSTDIVQKKRPLIYISLGTVIRNPEFYQNCIDALRNSAYDVVMSVGDERHIALLQDIPRQFQVKSSVPQLQVLQKADVCVTHCGMNSVNESIYFEVPMVLAPQQSEQSAVAQRTQEVGAGIILKSSKPENIKAAVTKILSNKEHYRKNIKIIADSFRSAGGPKKAADKIEQVIRCYR